MKKIHIFSSPEERARGLQFYPKMDKDELALFIEPESKSVVFNNKNVDFNISISFYDKNGELIKMEQLPKYSNGLKQVECNNAKYIIEKTASMTKFIPRNMKTTRKTLAAISRKGSKFVETTWKKIDPTDLKTKKLPYQFQAIEFGTKASVNSARKATRTLAKQFGTNPTRLGAFLLDVINTAAIPFGGSYLPIFKAYTASETAAKAVANAGKKLIGK